MTAIIYTTPSADSLVESTPPDLVIASDKSVIIFPPGGGYDENYWIDVRSGFTVVEASINLCGLDMLNSTQLEHFEVATTDTNDDVSIDPQVVTDIYGNQFVVWVDNGNIGGALTDLDIFVDQFDGVSWKGPTLLSDMKANTVSTEPAVATDPSGNVHVVWSEESNAVSSGPDRDIFYKIWTGSSWSSTPVLISDMSSGDSISPEIATDSSGNVYVIWVDNDNIQSSGFDNDIMLRYYDFQSSSWSNTFVVSSDTNDGDSIEPAITSFGNTVYIAWSENGNIAGSGSDYDIILCSYTGTAQLLLPIVVSTDINDDISRNAALAANDTRVYVVWQDNGKIQNSGTDYDIILTSLDLSNLLFEPFQIVTDSTFGESANPDIILDNFYNLYISWEDNGNIAQSGTDWDIYYRIKDKLSFRSPELLTDSITSSKSTNVSLALSHDNHIQFVWQDPTNLFASGSDEDIFLKDIYFEFLFPTNPKLDIGDDSEWDWFYTDNNGIFSTGLKLEGEWLGLKLTSVVKSYSGNEDYVRIHFKFYSDTAGVINITKLSVRGTSTPQPPTNLRVIGENQFHVVNHQPTLVWEFSDLDSASQGRFEVDVGTTSGGNDVWDPAPAETSDTWLKYLGSTLEDGETYYFRVRVTDCDDSTWSDWSEPYEFRMNSAPSVISLTPLAGTFDHNITLFWAGEDDDNDNLTYFLRAFYDGAWHTIVEESPATSYIWDTTDIAEQNIDFECYAFDGFENSTGYNPLGNIYISHNTPPTLEIVSPRIDVKPREQKFIIEWTTLDPDEGDILKISLFYDVDTDPIEKNLIVEDLRNQDDYEWDTSEVPPGEYYIAGEVTDGTDVVVAYSTGTIIVGTEDDKSPPMVVSTTPPNNAVNIHLYTDIKVIFDKDIDSTSINFNTFYIKDSKSRLIEGEREYKSESKELVFDPKSTLQFNTKYTVVLTHDIRDMDGLKLDGNGNGIVDDESGIDDYSWTFSTMMKEFDTTLPEVISSNPEQGMTDVKIGTTIKINFSEPIEPSSINSRSFLVLKLDDMRNWNGSSFETLISKSMEGVVSYNTEHFQAIFTPSEPLDYETTYVVSLTTEIVDLSGNHFEGYIFSFTTGSEEIIEDTEEDEKGDEEKTIVEVFQWDYFYYVFIFLLIVLILIATTFINRRIIMGPIRIRDIFIIYNDGRLLYHHRPKDTDGLPASVSQDIDDSAVSSMLTAIQDFVKDSFKLSRSSGLNELRHGTLRILIEHGNNSYVAVVCSGGPTTKIRKEMKEVIYDLNTKYGIVLDDWDGNMNSIAGIDKLLVPLITMERGPQKK
ncbi:MAG: Ig-like domain-containing protein [Thermoplasmata archaeon]|nr:MAG: Ig-like domain-containing protein [Thermoplasmata archaeon]